MSDKKLKQLVLSELSRNACVSTDTSFEIKKNNKDKSTALRNDQKANLHIGSQMNNVQRKIPKKLMFM